MVQTDSYKKKCLRASFGIVTLLLLGITGVTDIVIQNQTLQGHLSPIKVYNSTEQTLTNIKTTECSYMKQFVLGNGKRLSVCKYHGVTRIDIRQFIRGRTTIHSIWLRNKKWKNLLDQLPSIMLALIQSKKV